MRNQELEKQLTSPSKNSRLEIRERVNPFLFGTNCFYRCNDFNFRCAKRIVYLLC